MKRVSFSFSALVAIGVGIGHHSAQAQFAGDVFFIEPSVVVAQGSTGYLRLALFTGSKPFGATRASMSYDANKMEVVSVEPVAAATVTPKIVWNAKDGQLTMLVVNGQSLTAPFGTVSLARIGVKPLVASGERISLTSAVQTIYATDKSSLSPGAGFGAEINVGAVVVPSASIGAAQTLDSSSKPNVLQVSGQSEYASRLRRMRPAGHTVELYTSSGTTGQFVKVVVQMPASVVSADAPPMGASPAVR